MSNRFFAIPSYRNRIIGTQFFKYDVEGFLQWGYNFYYTNLSRRLIDPYHTTDCDCAFPSGDAFSVYPGPDGAYESLRLKVFHDALQDLRAMQLLSSLAGKDNVLKLIEHEAGMPIDWKHYPHSADFILNLRSKINLQIESHYMQK